MIYFLIYLAGFFGTLYIAYKYWFEPGEDVFGVVSGYTIAFLWFAFWPVAIGCHSLKYFHNYLLEKFND